jgi:hypothetical protein
MLVPARKAACLGSPYQAPRWSAVVLGLNRQQKLCARHHQVLQLHLALPQAVLCLAPGLKLSVHLIAVGSAAALAELGQLWKSQGLAVLVLQHAVYCFVLLVLLLLVLVLALIVQHPVLLPVLPVLEMLMEQAHQLWLSQP